MHLASISKKTDRKNHYTITAVALMFIAVTAMNIGCGMKHVRLTPSSEVRSAFMEVDINPADYAFFTTGPDDSPEAILLIKNEYLGDFDSTAWTLRDKQTVMNMIEDITESASEGKKYGFPVLTEKGGPTKGMIFAGYRHGRVYVDKEEGVFRVATPAMMDTGGAMFKRSKCSISICN